MRLFCAHPVLWRVARGHPWVRRIAAPLLQHYGPEDIDRALAAVCDLLIPSRDLHLVEREDLGTLLRLLRDLRLALDPPA